MEEERERSAAAVKKPRVSSGGGKAGAGGANKGKDRQKVGVVKYQRKRHNEKRECAF